MRIFIYFFSFIVLQSCGNAERPLPKPHQYPRIDFPERSYSLFTDGDCAMKFDIPEYAQVEKKTTYFNEKPLHPCWFDVSFPAYNGKLHCSYFEITSREVFDDLVDDAFDLVSKHRSKASFAKESVIAKDDVYGLLFDIDGPVASPLLFYVTDSTDHFFLASLYFKNRVNPDSMQVIHEFVREDVLQIIETFEWID